MRYRNILLFTIPSTLKTGHFNDYFIERSENLYLYHLPLAHQPGIVTVTHYHRGHKQKKYSFGLYKGTNTFLRYIFFYVYYTYIVLTILPKKTIVMSTIPLFCLLSGLIDRIKQVRIVYHIGDYYPNPKGIMRVFDFLTHYYNRHLKYVVYCSPIIKKIYYDRIIKDYNARIYWGYGIKKRIIVKKIEPNLLGYVGVLREGQGIRKLIFEALKNNKQLRLEIIGDGSLLPDLKKDVIASGLKNQVIFWGLVNDNTKLLSIIKRWEIGLSTNEPSTNNVTYYGEPSKIKFYIEYGLPIIMTKITYMQNVITDSHAGRLIDFTVPNLLEAINTIQSNYELYVSGVKMLSKKYEYVSYYDNKFAFFNTVWLKQ